MYDVYCSGCHRKIGTCLDQYPNRYKVFCDARCAYEPPVTAEAERNDAWQLLSFHGRKPVAIAKKFGSPHGQVYRTLDRLGAPLAKTPEDWVSPPLP